MRGTAAAGLLGVLALVACGEPAAGPGMPVATLAPAVRWPAASAHSVFGAGIDHARIAVYRMSEQQVVDHTEVFPGDRDELRLRVSVPLEQRVESLWVSLELAQGTEVLYAGYADVILRLGALPAMPELPLHYVGPGWDAAWVTITPPSPRVAPGGTLLFTAVAQNQFQAIVSAPIAWSVSHPLLATISPGGLLTARAGVTGMTWVRALTPTGVTDSVFVEIMP